jgi:hypothetical protein
VTRPSISRFAINWPMLTRTFEIACAGLALLSAFYVIVTTIRLVTISASPIPFWDQWGSIVQSNQQVFSSWLYQQHNEHRIVFPRLIFVLDFWLFRQNNEFSFVCIVVIPLVICAVTIIVASKTLVAWRDRVWIAGFVIAALFSAMQFENFAWSFQVGFFLVELGALGSFAVLGLGAPSYWKIAGVILCETIAVYSLASGILVPLIAIPLAVFFRYTGWQIAAMVFAAVALLGSYLCGYVTPPYHSDPLEFLHQLGIIAAYVIAEIGNPFTQIFWVFTIPHPERWAFPFGALGIALFALSTGAVVQRRHSIGPSGAIFLAVAAFVIGAALLTALGRIRFGVEQANASRYSSPVLLFWVVSSLIGFGYVVNHRSHLRPAVMAAGLCCLAVLAVAQPRFVKFGEDWVLPRREATTALLTGVGDVEALGRVYPNGVGALERAVDLRARHLSIFSEPWSQWLDTPLGEHIRIADPSRCRGVIATAEPVLDSLRPGWRVSGWAWDNNAQTAPNRIVMTDDKGRVEGYGLNGFFPSTSPDMPHRTGWKRSGWRGHFTLSKSPSVIAYALLDHDNTACRLSAIAVR